MSSKKSFIISSFSNSLRENCHIISSLMVPSIDLLHSKILSKLWANMQAVDLFFFFSYSLKVSIIACWNFSSCNLTHNSHMHAQTSPLESSISTGFNSIKSFNAQSILFIFSFYLLNLFRHYQNQEHLYMKLVIFITNHY